MGNQRMRTFMEGHRQLVQKVKIHKPKWQVANGKWQMANVI